ncbi:MAG: DUF5335 family protein [Armatimonadota bacterium]
MAMPENTPQTTTEVVPRGDWEQFLDQFTEMNAETTVRVEILGAPETGAQILSEEEPLLAVTLDEEAGVDQLIIECGDTVGSSPASFRHVVSRPTAIWVRKTGPVGWDALQIESPDGAVVLTVNPHPGRGDLHLDETGRSEISM